ncbi:MAG TPA: response regulator transcription factor [Dinghuibacter sp.]|uniref:response regulator transcription factor n=1 Tax=Dinghuibacter sp. TaxID=2024697 RepID=UPI002C48BA9F|nr:response regulator transcription factor [Dinghuibacter sp.]HTJ12468.1 response regulator transcription factor [Dinghuibacter sp.]
MTSPIRLVIADDHEIFRDGLALMLSRQKNMTLAGQAADGGELLAMVRETQPDVVLADIKMPHMDGIEATKILLQEFPDLKIIALSMFSEENLIVEMLEAGAKGYLLKNADKQEILDAIASVVQNQEYYCRDTSVTLASMIVKSNFSRKKEVIEFSDRELEIIKLICKQFTAQEMGESMFLSRRTVEGYRTRILEKMNVKNTAGVVIYALKNKLISEKELL